MSVDPPLPLNCIPRTDNELLDWICLIRSRRVGPTTFMRLMRQFGSATEALAALPDIAADAGVTNYRATSRQTAIAELRQAESLGAVPLLLGSEDYPERLYDLPDMPPLLWALGDTTLLDRPTIAIVGARNSSAVGQRMATRLASELGELGYVVASGLARGIDTAAHKASLQSGTIAVQAGGIDVVYPKENAELCLRIAEEGLRLAEMPPGVQPLARHFPSRNRIIAGLSQAIVVVEGAARSGSLITARNALDIGRDVMAVPGSPLDPRSAGCNMLIRDGAVLVRNAEDVQAALDTPLAKMQPPAQPKEELRLETPPATSTLPDQILTLLSPTPTPEDQVIRNCNAAPTQVLAVLAELDVCGKIDRQPGGMVALAP